MDTRHRGYDASDYFPTPLTLRTLGSGFYGCVRSDKKN